MKEKTLPTGIKTEITPLGHILVTNDKTLRLCNKPLKNN